MPSLDCSDWRCLVISASLMSFSKDTGSVVSSAYRDAPLCGAPPVPSRKVRRESYPNTCAAPQLSHVMPVRAVRHASPPLPNLDHDAAAYPSLDDAPAGLYDARQIDLASHLGELARAEIGCQSLPGLLPPFQRTHHGINADE